MATNKRNEDIQRALNESKKRRLEERYGARFGDVDPSIPPEIEEAWLNEVEEFEQAFENAKMTTVRRFVGSPVLKPIAGIPPEELHAELGRILDVLGENNICINFLKPRPEEEMYEFIVDELMNMEIEDVRAGGYVTNFIYEEFHPDDEEDAKEYARDFFRALLSRDAGPIRHRLSEEDLRAPNGDAITPEQMVAEIEAFQSRFLAFTTTSVSIESVELESTRAVVRATVSWSGLEGATMRIVTHGGNATIRLIKCDFGGWDVVQAIVPGWSTKPA